MSRVPGSVAEHTVSVDTVKAIQTYPGKKTNGRVDNKTISLMNLSLLSAQPCTCRPALEGKVFLP